MSHFGHKVTDYSNIQLVAENKLLASILQYINSERQEDALRFSGKKKEQRSFVVSRFSQIGISILCGLMLWLFVGKTSYAVVSIALKCPKKFVGEVTRVADATTPFTSFPKIDVDFLVLEKITGVTGSSETVQLIKNSGYRFHEGDRYQIEMKNNFICSIKKVES